jgi:hypothetical protein
MIASNEIVTGSAFYAKPDKPGKPDKGDSGVDVNIRSIGDGALPDTILQGSTIEILVYVSGDGFSSVHMAIDGGASVQMAHWRSSTRYFADWDTTGAALGVHSITVTAKDSSGADVGTDTKTVTIVDSYQAEVFFEIDYMEGVQPPQSVIDYWVAYWDSRAIKLTVKLDDVVPFSTYVTDLWAYEAQYNDHEFAGTLDDRGGDVFRSQEKWVLWGYYSDSAQTGGYCFIDIYDKDLVAGNYIFIAAGMCMDYEADTGDTNYGCQVSTLMHEAGHAIGVAKVNVRGFRVSESYDGDIYSVMSYIYPENTDFNGHWYYSTEYWNTRNLEFY